jgi:hypothetical protein
VRVAAAGVAGLTIGSEFERDRRARQHGRGCICGADGGRWPACIGRYARCTRLRRRRYP